MDAEKIIEKMTERQRELYGKISEGLLVYDKVGEKSDEEIVAKATELGFETDYHFINCILAWTLINFEKEKFLEHYNGELDEEFYLMGIDELNNGKFDW